MRKYLSILTLFLSVTACIYPYTPDLEEAPEGILTVDANISIGETSTVRLGTLQSLWKHSQEDAAVGNIWNDLSKATVWVESDAGDTYPGTLIASTYGYSYLDPYNPVFAIPTDEAPADRRYRLVIEALDATYTTDWNTLIQPPVIEEVEFAADDEMVTALVSVNGGPDATGYMLLSYDEAWEFHAEYPITYKVDPNTWTVTELTSPDYSRYWCWKLSDNKRVYPVDYTAMSENGVKKYPLYSFLRTDNRNHKRYCLNLKVKSLSRETYRFLYNLESGSEGGDNLFTPNPGEIPGNIVCETDPERTVLGYAIFSKTATKRFWLDSRYAKHKPGVTLDFAEFRRWSDLYKWDYRPVVEDPNPELPGPYGWGPDFCYDCTAAGGTMRKPSYWDETE